MFEQLWVWLMGILGLPVSWAAVRKVLLWLKERAEKYANQQHVQAVLDQNLLYTALNIIAVSTKADRVMLLCGQDGGGIPTASSDYRVGVYLEWWGAASQNVQLRWNGTMESTRGRVVQGSYLRMMQIVLSCGWCALHTTDLPEHDQLKDIYVEDGIKRSKIFHVGMVAKENKHFFVSCAFKRPKIAFGEEQRNVIRGQTMAMAKLLKAKPHTPLVFEDPSAQFAHRNTEDG